MSSTSGKVQARKAMSSIPGYDDDRVRYEGGQPVFIAARFISSEEINWGYATFVIEYVGGLWEDDESDIYDWNCQFDYEPEDIRSHLYDDLECEHYEHIKWRDRCGMGNWKVPHILVGEKTEFAEAGFPEDNYWEICVINRDQAEFWNFLMTGDSENLGVGWITHLKDPLSEVLNWARDNPDEAEAWLNASPTPEELCEDDEDLAALLAKVRRAIRQGRVE